MADLQRTIEHVEDEESADDDCPKLASGSGLRFDDLGSNDDSSAEDAGWDFEAQHSVKNSAMLEQTIGLGAKIQARLEQRALWYGSAQEGEAAEVQQQEEGAPKKKKKKKGKKQGEVAADCDADKSAEAKAAEEPSASKVVKPKVKAEKGTPTHLNTGMHFSELKICRPLLRALTDLGFETPTPIQRDVVPSALQGHDILATAETGSGKTASFLLPTLERLCQSANVRSRKRDGDGRVISKHVATKALVLLPTRELAVQCHAMLRNLAKYAPVTYQLVAGGFTSGDQASALRRQPDIVVATPGRMLDHLLNTQSVHMELLEIVIFDEADRLLELGFREECMQVLKCCSKGRQTMLFSATHNDSVEDLAKLALVKPVRVSANVLNRVTETLEQEFVKTPSESLREAVLMSLVARSYKSRVIVFCSTKNATHRLAIIFGLQGLRFAELHGNLPQGDRVKALQNFQKGDADFLLATDLAARGLDLEGVDTVINFHIPIDIARYIHRVGRTARMGRAGRAVTIYTPEEYSKVKKLGRKCCTEVKAKVLKRTVAADAVEEWAKKVASCQEDIYAIINEEKLEREFRIADTLTERADNLQKHKDTIRARPEKQWYMSNKEKENVRDAQTERSKSLAQELGETADETAAAVAAAKRQKREKKDTRPEAQKNCPQNPAEIQEERKRRQQREALQRNCRKEKEDRKAQDDKIRRSAKRKRSVAKKQGTEIGFEGKAKKKRAQ